MWQSPISVDIDLKSKSLVSLKIKEILYNRGLKSLEDIEEFIEPASLPDPLEHFPDLKKAALRVKNSILKGEQIAICGDYDADGMTSTALIVDVITKLHGKPIPIIPSRIEEGYGLNKTIVEKINKEGINLIITVDNGVSALEAINYATSLDIEIIITDHHSIKDNLNNIYALIHPHLTPPDSPYKNIAGVGVAYILAQQLALELNKKEVLNISRDLVCIGTIADMANLSGANRFWVKNWLEYISSTECKGLKGIIKNARINNTQITSTDISYKIAPRINSIGRIDDPKLIIDLLLESDGEQLEKKLNNCEEINRRRRVICKAVEEEAMNILRKKNNKLGSFILLAQPHWHHGVLGIVAARIMERYNKPTAIVSSEGDGIFRASLRSPANFNIIEALNKCSDLLEKFGGHKSAAGLTVQAVNLLRLEERLNSLSENWYKSIGPQNNICPECFVNFKDINEQFLYDYNKLEPFGIGNPKPLFWSRNVEVIKQKYGYLGQLILTIRQDDIILEAIMWKNHTDIKFVPNRLDIVFNIDYRVGKKVNKTTLNILNYRIYKKKMTFTIKQRKYKCHIESANILYILNEEGNTLKYNIDTKKGFGDSINFEDVYIKALIKIGLATLGIY